MHSHRQTSILSLNPRIAIGGQPAGDVDRMTSLSSPTSLTYNAIEEDDTQRLGLELGRAALPGLVIGLNGDLGAGKTRLVRAIVEGLDGSPRDVSSPTFVLLQHYPARLEVHHADAYRLKSSVEFLDLGSEEWIGDTGVALIEWAQRVADALPTDRLDIQITVTGEFSRRFNITAGGPISRELLRQLPQL